KQREMTQEAAGRGEVRGEMRGSAARALDLHQKTEERQRDWDHRELADDIKEVVAVARPPVGRHAPLVLLSTPLTLTLSPGGRGDYRIGGQSRFPYGGAKRMVVSSLGCWIAFAGSTGAEGDPSELQ